MAIKKKAPCKAKGMQDLLKAGILKDFVRKNVGEWNHQQWLELCEDIKKQDYCCIDLDQVGLKLEEEKAKYLKCGACTAAI